MKSNFKNALLCLITTTLLCLFTACVSPPNDMPSASGGDIVIGTSAISEEKVPGDRPTVPKDVAQGIDYLYDFAFSERYDDKVSDAYSLTLTGTSSQIGDTLCLKEQYHNELYQVREYIHNGDGILPYMRKSYWYTFDTGSLVIGTDYYEPDRVEYISCLWSNIEGVKTNQDVAVGSTENDVLTAYPGDLYYVDKNNGAEPYLNEPYEEYNCDFDYAYLWQPYLENDIRDITFYIKDGMVVAIETVQPYELRYVYGYDSEAGLQYANEQREKLND